MKTYFSQKLLLILLSILLVASLIHSQDKSYLPKIKSATGLKKIDLMNDYAATFIRKFPSERLKISKEALSEAQKLNYTKGIAFSLNNCGLSYYYLNNYKKALQYFQKVLPLFRKLKDSVAVGGIYNNMANAFQKWGKIDSSFHYNKLALKIRQKINAKSAVATSITNLGLLELTMGNFQDALHYFQIALDLRRQVGRALSIASSLNNIGTLYWHWGNLSSALEYYEKSLKLSFSENYIHGIVITELNIGLINIDLGALDFAEKYIKNAISEADTAQIKKGVANGYYYLSILNNKKGKFLLSLKEIEKCLPYFENTNDFNALSKIHTLKAKNFIKIRQYKSAKSSLNTALKYSKNVKDNSLQASVMQVIGSLDLVKHRYHSALKNTKSSLKINMSMHQIEKVIQNYLQLANIQMEMGNYKSAAKSFQQYIVFKDSLFNQKLTGNIANWRVKYETAKKENEILKLNKENELHLSEISKQKTLRNLFIIISFLILLLLIMVYYFSSHYKKMNRIVRNKNKQLDDLNRKLEEQNSKLTTANDSKDKLFSIVAHDLKGPFNGLMGLTSILDEEIHTMNEEDIKVIAKSINSSSKRLFKLTKNLLDWARIQTETIKPNPESIKLQIIIEEFVETIKPVSKEKEIELNYTIFDGANAYCDPQILDTILRNLINNAIKFTHKGGVVSLIINEVEHNTQFIIKDSGVGIKPEELKIIFSEDTFISNVGTNGEKGNGLGIKICKELVEMSGGKLEGKSVPGEGTEFKFTLPKNLNQIGSLA